MPFLDQHSTCPRLLDYLVIVGHQNVPTGDLTTQAPKLLRCFPETSHSDFELPNDVKYFCQPEGCIVHPKITSESEPTSFVFTLMDKDTGKVRFGISLNYYRLHQSSEPVAILTSICLISHHTFFTKFRECLRVLHRLLESSQTFLDDRDLFTSSSNLIWTLFVDPNRHHSVEQASLPYLLVRHIELWISRLLSTPAPLAGKSYVSLSLLPSSFSNPLSLAVPDKTRLSLVDFPLHLPMELLGVETCLKVLTAIMLEQKVILQSRDYNALTMSVMAFIAMLYPLQYMFPAIPLLPTSMDGAENLLLSPTPYLIGIPAGFLTKKCHFRIPPDVWLVDLDANKMMGSAKLDPLPPIPYAEGLELRQHLKEALKGMSSFKPVDTVNMPNNLEGGTNFVDVDSVDVATRVAMIRFFNSPNILANLIEHTRTIRLFPRPVVAFQYYSFLKSRPVLTPFVQRLAQTQAVEFFSEWCLYPENEVYQRIHAGVVDPTLIGDKAQWFVRALPHVDFDVWAQVGSPLLECVLNYPLHGSVDQSSLVDFTSTATIPDPTAQYQPPLCMEDQLRDAVRPTLPVTSKKKTRPQKSVDSMQFAESPVDARALASQATVDFSLGQEDISDTSSSDMDDTDIWDLKTNEHPDIPEHQSAEVERKDTDFSLSNNPPIPRGFDADIPNGSVKDRRPENRYPPKSTDSGGDANYSSERPSRLPADHHVRFTDNDEADGDSDSLEETTVGKLLLTNLGDNFADVASQATSTLSNLFRAPKRIAKRSTNLARRIVTELKSDSASPTQSKDDSLVARVDHAISKSDQNFLLEVAQMVCEGQQLTGNHTSKLRDLLVDENYRSYLILKINAILQAPQAVPDEVLPDVNLNSRAVYTGFTRLLHCAIRGLENTCTNHGIGGLASAMRLLGICHTYYVYTALSSKKDTSTRDSGRKSATEENIIGAVAGWFRSATKELQPSGLKSPVPAIKRNLARPVTGLFSLATRLVKPEEGQKTPNAPTVSTTGVPHGNDAFHSPPGAGMGLVSSSSPETLSIDGSDNGHSVDSGDVKGSTNGGRYYFVNWQLLPHDVLIEDSVDSRDRTYLYEALVHSKARSRLWDHMQFWEDMFFDTVAQERDILGLDQAPMDSLKQFSSLDATERKLLQNFEDRLLTGCLLNLVACMVMMRTDKAAIASRIHRIQARCRLAAHFSNSISCLLDQLHLLNGNSIKLMSTATQCNFLHCTTVRTASGAILALEIYESSVVFRDVSGRIVTKWILTSVEDIASSKDALNLTVRQENGALSTERFYCIEAESVHSILKTWMERQAAMPKSDAQTDVMASHCSQGTTSRSNPD